MTVDLCLITVNGHMNQVPLQALERYDFSVKISIENLEVEKIYATCIEKCDIAGFLASKLQRAQEAFVSNT